ncbi:MAG: TIGR03936 family radical SAM-associated protein, partial [Actinomycetota bacterium]
MDSRQPTRAGRARRGCSRTEVVVTRLRVRYNKRGRVRFLSHRDVARCLERAVRRAGLPVAYSQGFSPRARLHFGL